MFVLDATRTETRLFERSCVVTFDDKVLRDCKCLFRALQGVETIRVKFCLKSGSGYNFMS